MTEGDSQRDDRERRIQSEAERLSHDADASPFPKPEVRHLADAIRALGTWVSYSQGRRFIVSANAAYETVLVFNEGEVRRVASLLAAYEARGQGVTESKGENVMEASREMPRYRCHKEVWALKIKRVDDPTKPHEETDGSRVLVFEDGRYAPIPVQSDYVRKHQPQAGGYYVVYEDGYKSWSPAKAFEDGYTLING